MNHHSPISRLGTPSTLVCDVTDLPPGSPAAQEQRKSAQAIPENEKEFLAAQIAEATVKVTLGTIYRHAGRKDKLILLLSVISALAAGTAQPFMTLIFGTLSGFFGKFFEGEITRAEFTDKVTHYTLFYVYIAIGEFLVVWLSTAGFIYTGSNITRNIRQKYLAAILSQNIAFFETLGAGEITTSITHDADLMQIGISENVGLILMSLSTVITAIAIAFAHYWKLSLILLSTIVAMLLVSGGAGRRSAVFKKLNLDVGRKSSALAEEVFSSVQIVFAFNAQNEFVRKYQAMLRQSEKYGLKDNAIFSTMLAAIVGIIFWNYGLAFWMGSRFLVDGSVNLSHILTIVLCMMISALSLGSVAPRARALINAVSASQKLFSVIQRVPYLEKSTQPHETRLSHVVGDLELRNIRHSYPSRPDTLVLDDVSLHIPAGKITALVGGSGSGKSSIIGLIERFYEPLSGELFLDRHELRRFDLQWLRQQIALVTQEPDLFNTTIFENIAYGLIGTSYENVCKEEKESLIISAAKSAFAHEFICNFPERYETCVGANGLLLSGGQKQRIAIARALVSNPKILILDEATSALDAQTEGLMQAIISNPMQERAILVVAHRLSSVKSADNIVVLEKGRIVEQGKHERLMQHQGAYFKLVAAQQISQNIQGAGEVKTELEFTETLDAMNRWDISEPSYHPSDDTDMANSPADGRRMSEELTDSRTHSIWTLIKMVVHFHSGQLPILTLGTFFSVIAGGGIPTQAVFFGKAVESLSKPKPKYATLRHDVNFWSSMYLMLGLVEFVAYTIQGLCFAFSSERLQFRVRNQVFQTLLRQDITYFEHHSSSALSSFLLSQTTQLSALSGALLGTVILTSTTVFAILAISLAIGWKFALVTMSFIPVLLGSAFLQASILAQLRNNMRRQSSRSIDYICEAVSSMRTVASLTMEADICERYRSLSKDESERSFKLIAKFSMLFAASESLRFLCFALGSWYGGRLIAFDHYNLFQFFTVFVGITFGIQSAGAVFLSAPDIGKSREAGTNIKNLLDRAPQVDSWSPRGVHLAEENVKGSITFQDVSFRYPSRPDSMVLEHLSFIAKEGQHVALVGLSGCGKSTVISLIERFYRPSGGLILLDGVNIKVWNVNSYRRQLGLVSQNSVLYHGSIRDNILLGTDDDDHITEEKLIKACQDANIYDFIQSLPDGFSTPVGSRGTLLSGGQKQRIAIARALIRNPKVLLLDEATSALDSSSEKQVQDALDRAAKGRTTITIAHRLSTIRHADTIYVFGKGAIVESGTHNELMARDGFYRQLVALQSLETSTHLGS